MDAASALADLTEISSHVEAAAIFHGGDVVAATPGGERLGAGLDLLRVAEERLGRRPLHVEAALPEGSLFALNEGGHVIVARTGPRPPSALVLYDLGACLRDA